LGVQGVGFQEKRIQNSRYRLPRVYNSGSRVQGSEFRVGFRVKGEGCRVQGSGFGIEGEGFRVSGLGASKVKGFRVQGFRSGRGFSGFEVQGFRI
jgi:hypothetical protein